MDKLILKDGTKIEMVAGASLSAIQIESASRETMLQVWNKLTEENLKEIQIETAEGLTIGKYSDVLLVSETSVINKGIVETSFCMREKTEEEKRLDALEESQEIQDEAIIDLGAAASELAEKGGAK